MLKFIQAPVKSAQRAILDRLIQELETGAPVLWVVAGGSNIPSASAIMQGIPRELTSTLTIMLSDERYGAVNHPDSNIAQLLGNGFDPKQGQLLETLTGDDFESTIEAYKIAVEKQFLRHKRIIGQLGVGADGHTVGILPESSAAMQTSQLAVGYRAADFMRITLTFTALKRLSVVYALAYGGAKHDALVRLQDKTLIPYDQPAQILKAIPEVYVYNDQVG